ncbi:MAG: ribosomal protein S18 acetylase RimI-like enzyme [Rhodothermales bacterium]|jgi:ribosomal protein S18 acetylase RimI-like enzyme
MGATDSFRLVPAQAEHLDILASWPKSQAECDTWSGHNVTFPVDRLRMEREIKFATVASFALLRAGELVAFGQIFYRSRDRGHVARLIVHPEMRGLGIGKDLIAELIAAARAGGARTISLNVNSDNEGGVRFYRRLGFAAAERPAEDLVPPTCFYMERPAGRDEGNA